MSTTVLGHVESLNNSRAQSAIPRYRKRGPVKEYVFAAKLKKAPLWLVVGEEWGFISEDEFEHDYIASNDMAREPRRRLRHEI